MKIIFCEKFCGKSCKWFLIEMKIIFCDKLSGKSCTAPGNILPRNCVWSLLKIAQAVNNCENFRHSSWNTLWLSYFIRSMPNHLEREFPKKIWVKSTVPMHKAWALKYLQWAKFCFGFIWEAIFGAAQNLANSLLGCILREIFALPKWGGCPNFGFPQILNCISWSWPNSHSQPAASFSTFLLGQIQIPIWWEIPYQFADKYKYWFQQPIQTPIYWHIQLITNDKIVAH